MNIIQAIKYLNNGKCEFITSVENKTYTKEDINSTWHGDHYASFSKGNMKESEWKSKFWRINQ